MQNDWLVDQVLPHGELHIIGGPSGGGKTTWLLQFIRSWQCSQPIWNLQTYPKQFVYISLDRGEKSLLRTFKRLGIDASTFPYVAALNLQPRPNSTDDIFEMVRDKFPDAEVIFVDGLAILGPNAKNGDYKSYGNFVAGLSSTCNKFGVTVFGVMHCPKMKENEKYSNPRQRLLGSVAWAAFSETIILIEPDETHPNCRTLHLLPRNAPEKVYRYELDAQGMFSKEEDYTGKAKIVSAVRSFPEAASSVSMVLLLSTIKPGEIVETSDIVDQMEAHGVSRSQVFFWLKKLVEEGTLEIVGRGKYRKPKSS